MFWTCRTSSHKIIIVMALVATLVLAISCESRDDSINQAIEELSGEGEFAEIEDAMRELVSIGKDAIPHLVKAIDTTQNSSLFQNCVSTLYILANDHMEAVDALVDLSKIHSDSYLERQAKKAALKHGRDTELSSPADIGVKPDEIHGVLEHIRSENTDIEIWTPTIISKESWNGRGTVVPQIVLDVGVDRGPYFFESLTKLADLGEAGYGSLIELLNTEDSCQQAAAAYAISLNEEFSDQAVPNLTELLSSSSNEVLAAAVGALATAGPEAAPAVPFLSQIVSTSNNQAVRLVSIVALGRIGKAASAAIPVLNVASELPNSEVIRLTALYSKKLIEKEKPPEASAVSKSTGANSLEVLAEEFFDALKKKDLQRIRSLLATQEERRKAFGNRKMIMIRYVALQGGDEAKEYRHSWLEEYTQTLNLSEAVYKSATLIEAEEGGLAEIWIDYAISEKSLSLLPVVAFKSKRSWVLLSYK